MGSNFLLDYIKKCAFHFIFPYETKLIKIPEWIKNWFVEIGSSKERESLH